MSKVGVYNEDGEPLGFDYIYDEAPADDWDQPEWWDYDDDEDDDEEDE